MISSVFMMGYVRIRSLVICYSEMLHMLSVDFKPAIAYDTCTHLCVPVFYIHTIKARLFIYVFQTFWPMANFTRNFVPVVTLTALKRQIPAIAIPFVWYTFHGWLRFTHPLAGSCKYWLPFSSTPIHSPLPSTSHRLSSPLLSQGPLASVCALFCRFPCSCVLDLFFLALASKSSQSSFSVSSSPFVHPPLPLPWTHSPLFPPL